MTTGVTLVRHGRTSWNDGRRLIGRTDVPLDEEGRRQARLLADVIDASGFDGVWASDLLRAVETARLAGWRCVVDQRLREFDFGVLEGSTWDELDGETRRGLVEFDGFVAPGGESEVDFRARVYGFLDGLEAGSHLVVTHGGVIRSVLRACDGGDRFPEHGVAHRVDWTAKRLEGQAPTV